MRTVAQSTTIALTVQFRLSSGQLVDPENVHADLIAPDGTITDLVQPDITREDVGTYRYSFDVPALAELGDWTIRWYGTVNNNTSSSDETFTVVSPSEALTTASIVTRLRRMLGERIPLGKTEDDTRFTDQEISDTFYINGEDINKTMAELWLSKAAYLGDFVDMNESGTMRSLSQMQKAALAQANLYAGRVSAEDSAWAATYRAAARSFSPYRTAADEMRVRAGAVVVVPYNPQRLWTGTL